MYITKQSTNLFDFMETSNQLRSKRPQQSMPKGVWVAPNTFFDFSTFLLITQDLVIFTIIRIAFDMVDLYWFAYISTHRSH